MNASAAFGEIPAAQPANRLMITLAVMSATLIQVLDTTIVNVALPHMQGELGATADQISWVLTSYLVASAIIMPLTGHFTDIWGRRRFLLICIGGFVAAFLFAEIISLGGLFSDLEWGYVLAFAFFIAMMFVRPAGLLARRS